MKCATGAIATRIVPVFFRIKMQPDFTEKVNRKQYSDEIYDDFLPHND
jgi:hypothetical protein